jgi:hypothetical protein
VEEVGEKSGYSMEQRCVFKITNMPSSVARKLVDYSRTRCGDRVWVAVDRLLELQSIHDRLDSIEKKLEIVPKKEEETTEFPKVKTFGGVVGGKQI